jgi:ubiquinone/menaquinone biosynthesis C-methylase UbiE
MSDFWKQIWDSKGCSDSMDLLFLCGWEHLNMNVDSKLIVNRIINELNIKPTDSVLEIGCGAGLLSREFQEYDYTGIDYSESLIEKHKIIFPEHNVLVADANLLPFEDNSFDCTFCSGVFQYLPDIEYALQVINEMTRVSKKSIMLVDLKSIATNDKHFIFPIDTFRNLGFDFSECMYCDDKFRYNVYKTIKK